MSAADTAPRGTKARILRRVANERYPKLVLGTIAANHDMTLADLQVILNRHGYPEPGRMLAEAKRLEQEQLETTGQPAVSADGPELGVLSEIPIEQLHPDPDNPRDVLSDIEDLAASMSESGLLQPVVARRHNGRLVLVAGHRRLAAAKHLRWTRIACIVRTDMRPDDVLAAMLIENGQRKDLDPIEEARGLKRLKVQLDCSDAELAKRIGRSQVIVSARLALLALSAEDQEQLRNGDMTLIEGTHKGRMNSGKVRPLGRTGGWHLGPEHPLATQVKARCKRLKHKGGRVIGGMGCGACWESVIKTDEREHLQEVVATTGRCTVCGHAEEATS